MTFTKVAIDDLVSRQWLAGCVLVRWLVLFWYVCLSVSTPCVRVWFSSILQLKIKHIYS